jgi:transcription antitermination protein NusB
MARRRHQSRIAVMQTLFERERHPGVDPVKSLALNIIELGEADTPFAEEVLTGVIGKEKDLRLAVETHAPQWPLERMDPISRAVLFVGAYELLFRSDAPPAVIMNEAIEVAKEFGSEEGAKFVNGVLNAIAHKK